MHQFLKVYFAKFVSIVSANCF